MIPPPEQLTPEALGAHHKAEIEKWVADDQGRRHQGAVGVFLSHLLAFALAWPVLCLDPATSG